MFWWPSSDGLFSVRLVYWLGKLRVTSMRNRAREDEDVIWEKIWRCELPPKLKHLLWRLYYDCVAYADLIFRRHISESSIYKLCESEAESLCHAIFFYPRVNDVWAILDSELDLSEAPSSSFVARFRWII